MENIIIPINETDQSKRIDHFLGYRLKEVEEFDKYKDLLSRSFIKEHLIKLVKVNGGSPKPSQKVNLDDEIVMSKEVLDYLDGVLDEKGEGIVSEVGELNILEEDEDYIILNKQHGIVVHPGVGNRKGTLANFLKGYMEGRGEYDSTLDRAGIVHRLDKAVGGLMVIAKNKKMQNHLKDQFESHQVLKIYVAQIEEDLSDAHFSDPVDYSELEDSLKSSWREGKKIDMSDWFELEGFVGRDPSDRIKMMFSTVQLTSDGKIARSYFRRIDDKKIAIRIVTGRMHQIRASLKFLGYTIKGDTLYGKGRHLPDRIELESSVLGFELENSIRKVVAL